MALSERDASFTPDPLRLYFGEIGRKKVLSPKEEVRLFQTIERGRSAQFELDSELSAPVRREELARLAEEGKRAKEEAIERNLRLVVPVVRKYLGLGLQLSDLIQEGNSGLLTAVERFEWQKGYKFSTYAAHWIRQAVSRAVINYGRMIRLPIHVHEKLRKVLKTQGSLTEELEREPTRKEIGEKMGLSAKTVKKILAYGRQEPISLETPFGAEEEDGTLADFIKDGGQTLEETVIENSKREEVRSLLGFLTPQELEVIILRHGLDGGEERTFQEIAKIEGFSRERARQLHARAFGKLRCRLEGKGKE